MGTRKLFNRTFDARADRIDFRDLPYRPPLVCLPDRFPEAAGRFFAAYAKAGMVLNQGEEGACTGFGLAAVVNYLRWRHAPKKGAGAKGAVRKVSPRMFYQNARLYDEWPGDDYEGSSCRGAMKGFHKHGVCGESKWPYGTTKKPGTPKTGWDTDAALTPLGAYYRIDATSLVEMQAAIVETHAVYVSADTHDGWDLGVCANLDKATIAPPRKKERGGHAFALVGYTEDGFIVQNSWGRKWGYEGFALLPYEDWVANGSDAWVLALGAPIRVSKSPRAQSDASLQELAGKGLTLRRGQKRPAPGVPVWRAQEESRHVVIVGDNGKPDRQLVDAADAADGVAQVAREAVEAAIAKGCRHIAVYAHGGLNSQAAGLKRARLMGPWFAANGIHPIFVVWRTGFLETMQELAGAAASRFLGSLVARDQGRFLGAQIEAIDGGFEAFARDFAVKPMWSSMKARARAASAGQGTMTLVADGLAAALSKNPAKDVKLHLLGHSAGALLHGEFLAVLKARGLAAASLHLWAPACTVAFANEKFGDAFKAGTLDPRRLFLSALSTENEKRDRCVPLFYSKSLLYLISRALESEHNTPVLGMEARQPALRKQIRDFGIFDPQALAALKAWDQIGKDTVDDPPVATADVPIRLAGGRREAIDANHGSFDNNLDVVNRAIERMLGGLPAKPVTDLAGF
ncbi:MAG: C1 family peptidase [Parvibaculum sp.]|uniref:C1 family peptidase n=1 Tax=Parvibaculum sp. TaxID=2024848 RepID=UPI002718ECDD|nr:C1 family peptidase [Parvibaculum sp.]MDO8837311.1 C1 family peptidase [Parvibaculum sp.]